MAYSVAPGRRRVPRQRLVLGGVGLLALLVVHRATSGRSRVMRGATL